MGKNSGKKPQDNKHKQSFALKKKVRRHEVYLLLGLHNDFPESYLRELIDKVVKDGYSIRYYDKYAFVDCTHYADSKAVQLALHQFKAGETVLEATLQKRPTEERPRPDIEKKKAAAGFVAAPVPPPKPTRVVLDEKPDDVDPNKPAKRERNFTIGAKRERNFTIGERVERGE